jgi:hypothetical protein
MEEKELLGITLDALDRLMRMFVVERYVYLALTAVSFLLLLYTGYIFVATKAADKELLIAIFGSSGLIAASSARISWFFNRAFTMVENLVKRIS